MSLVTSLYSLDIILVLFQWIIKQDYKKKYLVIGDWSQSNAQVMYHKTTENETYGIRS